MSESQLARYMIHLPGYHPAARRRNSRTAYVYANSPVEAQRLAGVRWYRRNDRWWKRSQHIGRARWAIARARRDIPHNKGLIAGIVLAVPPSIYAAVELGKQL